MKLVLIYNCFEENWVNLYKEIVNAADSHCEYGIHINSQLRESSLPIYILLYHFDQISNDYVNEFNEIVNNMEFNYLVSTIPKPELTNDNITRLIETIQKTSHFTFYRPFDPNTLLTILNEQCHN